MTAEAITRALGGRWHGSYGIACCPAHDNQRTPALSLKSGTDGRLLAYCHAGCDFRNIVAALRGRGLTDGKGPAFTPDPVRAAAMREAAKADDQRKIRRARACWAEAVSIAGSLAECYLRSRGIRCPLPGSLRFHPVCWHGATASKLPAMVAAVVHSGEIVAVHRTYLAEPGAKAKIRPDKAMLGPVRGGAVRLSKGTGPLVVAEGLETALSLVDGLGESRPRVWAALSSSGISAVDLPPDPGRLVISVDGDDAGRFAAHALAERATALGWAVALLPAPEGCDWNDVLREEPLS